MSVLCPPDHHSSLYCSLLLSSPSLFVLRGGLLSLKTVIRRKSCLATTRRDAKPLFTLHPITSCAHYPLLFHSPPDGVAWEGSEGSSDSCSLMNSDNRYRPSGEEEERRSGVYGRGITFGDAVTACCLPAAIPPFLSAGGTGHFPLTSFPLCITKEKLVSPQSAVISRTEKTGQQMRHMPGCCHTLMKKSSI